MMNTFEIARERWNHCLEQFSRVHAGQEAEVCTSGAAGGGASNADLPLIGVTSDAGAGDLHIMLGRSGGPHVDHVVPRPTRLWTAEWNDGVSGMLEIDADDGSTTLVRVGPHEELLGEGMILDGVPPERG